MHHSQLFVTLCGLGALQFASAQSDIPSFSLAVSSQAASSQAPKVAVYDVEKHQSMGKECKHRQKHAASGLPKNKSGPTTFATMAKSNITAAQAFQNYTSAGVYYQATVVVVTQTVVPVEAAASSVVVMSPAAAASSVIPLSASPSAAAVTISPEAQIQKVSSPSRSSRMKKVASSAVVAPVASAAPAIQAVPVASAVPAAQAAPVASSVAAPSAVAESSAGGLTAAQVIAVMPSSASCTSGTPAGECLTAAQAAPLLAQSFTTYGISNKGAQAAILALIALESGELKYNQHYNGGSPAGTGQGTYNEMSPSFVVEYAKVLFPSSAATDPLAAMNQINAVPLDSISSAAWFMKAKCPTVIAQFATSPDAAYSAYLGSGCIGTTQTADRTAYFTKAKAALGV
jgi:hypothetical protein